jgi:transcriptional regulator with XRE-family HTH domain
MKFGERLKFLRNKVGLTQLQFGEKFNLAESTISLYESDKRFPDQDTLLKLANFFDVSMDYLLGRSDSLISNESTIEPSNPDIRMLARSGNKLSPEDAKKLREMAELMFPEVFKK